MATEIKINTRDNLFQRADVLKRNRQKRYQYQEFFVEGVEPINCLRRYGYSVSVILKQQGQQLSKWAQDVCTHFSVAQLWQLKPELFAELSDKENPTELLVIAKCKTVKLEEMLPVANELLLLLDRPQSPGNLGSTLRSAAAFGINKVLILGHACDLYDPQTIRASIGNIFYQRVYHLQSMQELQNYILKVRTTIPEFKVIGTSHTGDIALQSYVWPRSLLLMLGNEGNGLSGTLLELCEQLIKINLGGSTTSLNLSCAASIFLYEYHKSCFQSAV